MVLAGGATAWRDIPVPGREIEGVYQAMEFLPWANHVQQGDIDAPPITAEGKHVVIIGGGDTGADCLGTSHRQGAASITQLEIMPTPPEKRTEGMPWPTYPMVYRVSSAHEEGGERLFSVNTTEFVADAEGKLAGAEAGRGDPRRRAAGSCRSRAPSGSCPCQLVLLAMGFLGPEKGKLLSDLGVELDERSNVARDRQLHDQRRGRVQRRRHGPRAVVDRLGDRRGPGRRGRASTPTSPAATVLPRPINPTDRPLT